MLNALLYGIGAGLLSTVVFASAMSGGFISVFLFMITPLPIFLVGLGVSWTSAAFAGAFAGLVISLLVNPLAGLAFAGSQIAPVVVLCFLAQLGRNVPDPQTGAPVMEWYPIGRMVLWSAALATALAIVMLLLIGGDMEALRASIRKFIEQIVAQQLSNVSAEKTLGEEDLTAITELTVRMLPGLTAISIMTSQLLNLWLAAKITLASGRLLRPWPDVAAIVYPTGTSLILAASLIASLTPGMIGVIGTAVSGVLLFAYVLLGLAIIHYVSRGKPWRPFLLIIMYVALFLNSALAILVAIVGLTETFSPLKRDFLRGPNQPPTPPPTQPPT